MPLNLSCSSTNHSPPLISHNENIGSEVPLFCCDSFPPGEAKGVLTFSVYALVGVDEYVDPSAALPPQMYRIPYHQLHSNPTMIAPSSA